MSKSIVALTIIGFCLGFASTGFATTSSGGFINKDAGLVFAQEDCKEGETWSEEALKCEKTEQ